MDLWAFRRPPSQHAGLLPCLGLGPTACGHGRGYSKNCFREIWVLRFCSLHDMPISYPAVHSITLDDEGLLISISTDPMDDTTFFVPYLRFSTLESLADCLTIQYSKLSELDRLGPGVDLVSYEDESGNLQKVAFKFNPFEKLRRKEMEWNELHILKNLPPPPNIVPLGHVVLEDAESRVIGYTTKYIPGGTLDLNKNIPFRFEWLKQLTEVVDFLNLEMGPRHRTSEPTD
jgi:hypothetical protein